MIIMNSTTGTVRVQENLIENYEEILLAENRYEAKALTPVTVYLVMLMIIGILGNTMVLYVYKFRFRRSTSRVFILSLAAFDLITCLFGMPYHILDLAYPYTFTWDEVCKSLSFALTFTILGSIYVLDLIAIDRYRKICKPLEKQLSAMGTKIICWVTAFVAAISASPMIFLYGVADVDTRTPNITGKECYISKDFAFTEFPLIYDGFFILVFLLSILIVSILYINVGIAVRKRKKVHEPNLNGSGLGTDTPLGSRRTVTGEDTLSTPLGSLREKDGNFRPHMHGHSPIIKQKSKFSNLSYNSPRIPRKINKETKKEKSFRQKLKRAMSDVSSGEYDSTSGTGTLDRGQGQLKIIDQSKMASRKQRRTFRITTMLFIITLIFVISFLPYLIIEVISNTDEKYWNTMETWELVISSLLYRTYFINNMVNPIVYWCLDSKFKNEVVKIFTRCKTCKH
ncbi:cholecystokinin receptor type A-like [Mytilus californianus]|uniref:cholecystokinin receptor type A-like n=1 Tax=Mytilus californianus TaxID=6549 RepID=UPI00224685A8|nr:cholecystokinin receptor type A-like [Mytilus californianus]